MKKYLCILAFPSGIAELANAGIVEAESEIEARRKFISFIPLREDAVRAAHAFLLDELPDGWLYYS